MAIRKTFLFTATFSVILAGYLSPATAQTLTATQRAAQFGLSEIRGVAYIPGPQLSGCVSIHVEAGKIHCFGSTGAKVPIPLDPNLTSNSVLPYFENGLQTYTVGGGLSQYLDVKYTINYDSDFYNADFQPLWGTPGRNDLGRYVSELNANFVHLYDWNAVDPTQRNHKPFLDYASSLGLHVTIPISNYTYQIICGNIPSVTNWQTNVAGVFNVVYANQSTTPHPAAGMLKIFNEYDASVCKNANYVAEVAAYWNQLENMLGVPDAQRLPIIFPVTFGEKHGLPGGAVLDAFNAIKNNSALGLSFWQARVIYATNPFNSGAFMKDWINDTLPKWLARNGIPSDTPVMFTEYGRSSDEAAPPNESGQATWVKEQFEAMYVPAKPTNFLGATAFVNEYRFWLARPEPNFALAEFNQGGGTWNLPSMLYTQMQMYQNPNAPIGTLWTAYYQVDPQKPRPAYCEIGKVFFGTSSPPQCP
jgi:hypothetical protein